MYHIMMEKPLKPTENGAKRKTWEPTQGIRFQCSKVERRHVRRLRVLAALNEVFLEEQLDTVLKLGLDAAEAVAKMGRSEE